MAKLSDLLIGVEIPEARDYSGEEESIEEYRRLVRDSEDDWDRLEARILNTRGKLQPLWPVKPGQRKLDEAVWGQKAARGYVRVAVVKARRVGSSTRAVRHAYRWICAEGGLCTIIAHKIRSTKTLFGMVHRFWRHETPEIRIPKGDVSRRDEFALNGGDGLERTFMMSTAGTPDALRSEGNQVLVMSEVPFFDDAESLAPAALNTMADGQGMVIAEGTSNGAIGWWYDFIQECLAGKNDYEVVFISWQDDPDCVRPATAESRAAWDGWVAARASGDLEAQRANAQRLPMTEADEQQAVDCAMSMEQSLWWMSKLTDGSCLRPGEDPRRIRRQEFPCTLEESFLSTGTQVFRPDLMMRLEALVRELWPGIKRYAVRVVDRNARGALAFEYREDPYGNFDVLCLPVLGESYVIGVDSEQGVSGDRSAVSVWTVDPFVQVARFAAGSIDPTALADLCAAVGWWYNAAFLVIELNGPGSAVMGWINNSWAYPNLYTRLKFDVILNQPTEHLGWVTDNNSKPVMVGELQRLLREGRLGARFPETIHQLKRYAKGHTGKLGAPRGDFDDEVIGAGLAAMGRQPEEFFGKARAHGKAAAKIFPVETFSTAWADDYLRKMSEAKRRRLQQTRFGRLR